MIIFTSLILSLLGRTLAAQKCPKDAIMIHQSYCIKRVKLNVHSGWGQTARSNRARGSAYCWRCCWCTVGASSGAGWGQKYTVKLGSLWLLSGVTLTSGSSSVCKKSLILVNCGGNSQIWYIFKNGFTQKFIYSKNRPNNKNFFEQ